MKNIVEQLKEMGAKFSPSFCLDSVNPKFVMLKDITNYQDYMYTMIYNKVPSSINLEYNKSRYLELIKYLIDCNYEVLCINSSYRRYCSDTVIFRSSVNSTIVSVGGKNNALSVSKIFTDDEEEEDVESLDVNISYEVSESPKVFELVDKFYEIEDHKPKGKIMLFEKTQYGDLILTPHKVRSYELDISKNYNDDFMPVHEKISKWMDDFTCRNNKLVLLHGEPGSGKTNYIKHLLNNSGEVKKIYIPPFFVQSMSDPGFFPVIKREKDSLLIIEDAEKVLINREESNDNSIISILLNLCDGIMADVLNFKIIATFNTDEDRIDAALKRKGRMFLKYKFDALSREKTQSLFRELYGQNPPKDRMTLAEIYNDENEYGPKKEVKSIGFGV